MSDRTAPSQVQQHDITPAGSNTTFPVNWPMVKDSLFKNPTDTPLQINMTDGDAISLADQIFPASSLVDILAKKARRDETFLPLVTLLPERKKPQIFSIQASNKAIHKGNKMLQAQQHRNEANIVLLENIAKKGEAVTEVADVFDYLLRKPLTKKALENHHKVRVIMKAAAKVLKFGGMFITQEANERRERLTRRRQQGGQRKTKKNKRALINTLKKAYKNHKTKKCKSNKCHKRSRRK